MTADGIISTLAGSTKGYSGDGGPAISAFLNNPVDVVPDTASNVYIADQFNNVVRKIDAHSTREFGAVRYGIDQARRAGLEPASDLNCLPWPSLEPLFRR